MLLLSGADYLTVFEPGQVNALVLLFLNAHGYGVLISEAFFSPALVVLGYLLFKSGYFPRFLGVLMVIASLGYLADSFGIFLFPGYEAIIAQAIIAPVVVGELAFTVWLLIKGLNVEQWEKRALESA